MKLNSGQMGIMLVYICQLLGLFQWAVRQSVEVENLMTSVERLLEYVALPSEETLKPEQNKKQQVKPSIGIDSNNKDNDDDDDDGEKEKTNLSVQQRHPGNEWPQNGEIQFESVSFRYDPSLPFVLQDVSFRIEAGEKVGIVGRTGAGKSSIIQTLFRMAQPNGCIRIDGVNICKIELKHLRSKISIIPVSRYLDIF